MTFLADVNRSGFQEDLVSNGEPAHILWKMPVSGAEIAPPQPCILALAVTRLPLVGDAPVCSQPVLLWYSLSPLSYEHVQLCLRLSFLRESSLSIFFVFVFLSLSIPQSGLLSHVSSLRLSSGHSGPIFTLSLQPTPPCSAPTCWWWTRASGPLLLWEL